VRPEEGAQGVVELGFRFQVGKVAGSVDQEHLGALEAADDLGGHRVVRPGICRSGAYQHGNIEPGELRPGASPGKTL
jgi:hypothetical protein